MADIKTGRFKAKGIKGSVQWGTSGEKETPQIAIDLSVKDSGQSITTFLYFSPDAAKFSFERLTALGWKGKGAADLANMDGIDTNEVDIEITEDTYQGKTSFKCQILTGPGRVTLKAPMEKNAFAARVGALLSGSGGGTDVPPMGNDDIPF